MFFPFWKNRLVEFRESYLIMAKADYIKQPDLEPFRDDPFSTYAKLSVKVSFLTSWYIQTFVPIKK